MGLSFALIALITAQTSILILLLILILTRIGASLVEAMVEGHFFRRVSEEDTDTVGVFRMMRPIGALIAPLLGSLFLLVSTYQELFVCMGLFIAIIGTLMASAVRSFRPSRTVLHAEPEHM
jgi:MFS family permease